MRNTQNATSVSSLDVRNTRKAHRNLQQIHLDLWIVKTLSTLRACAGPTVDSGKISDPLI